MQAFYQSYYYTVFDDINGRSIRDAAIRSGSSEVTSSAAYPLNRYYRLEGSVGFVVAQVRRVPDLDQHRQGQRRSSIPTPEQLPDVRRQAHRRHGRVPELRADLRAGACRSASLTRRSPAAPSCRTRAAPTLTFDMTADFRALLQDHRALAHRRPRLRVPGDRQPARRARLRRPRHPARAADYGIIGNSAAFLNFELRFPLIDFLATPILGMRDIRGKGFVDIGGAALKNQPFQFWSDYTLCGRRQRSPGLNGSSGGCRITVSACRIDFLGLPLHFDFARQWNFKRPCPPTSASPRPRDQLRQLQVHLLHRRRNSRSGRRCPLERRSPSGLSAPTAVRRPGTG